MVSWLSKLNPRPSFLRPQGPYNVGSIDVELPIDKASRASRQSGQLETENSPNLPLKTVQFRVFYPCVEPGPKAELFDKPRWIPEKNSKEYVAAYARFTGASPRVANVFSNVAGLLYSIRIPVSSGAPLLIDGSDDVRKWPVMIFSHGLGGTRNAYSALCSSLAAHGMVVFAVEHRDGSAPISFVTQQGGLPKSAEASDSSSEEEQEKPENIAALEESSGPPEEIRYTPYAHKMESRTLKGRDMQLEIRCREVAETFDIVRWLASSSAVAPNTTKYSNESAHLQGLLSGRLDLDSLSWGGHSFGSATMTQFIKSCAIASTPYPEPLFHIHPSHPLASAISSTTRAILLDLWALPLQSPRTATLLDSPLQGKVLAIMSDSFWKWKANMQAVFRDLAGEKFLDEDANKEFYYVPTAAHLSQSDFGVLFPRVTKYFLKTANPNSIMAVNVKKCVEFLRANGVSLEAFKEEPGMIYPVKCIRIRPEEQSEAKEVVHRL